MPKPMVQIGGIKAAAIATPANAAGMPLRAVAQAATQPDTNAMAASSRFGLPRASISSVGVSIGSNTPITIEISSASVTPMNRVTLARRVRGNIPVAMPVEKLDSGIISGATSMAPMITAALFVSKPSVASAAERTIMTGVIEITAGVMLCAPDEFILFNQRQLRVEPPRCHAQMCRVSRDATQFERS